MPVGEGLGSGIDVDLQLLKPDDLVELTVIQIHELLPDLGHPWQLLRLRLDLLGGGVLPLRFLGRRLQDALAVFPLALNKTKRGLRLLTLVCIAAFLVLFTAAFVLMVVQAGSFEFWHVWGWFRYVG